jgi:hypothetical protein
MEGNHAVFTGNKRAYNATLYEAKNIAILARAKKDMHKQGLYMLDPDGFASPGVIFSKTETCLGLSTGNVLLYIRNSLALLWAYGLSGI